MTVSKSASAPPASSPVTATKDTHSMRTRRPAHVSQAATHKDTQVYTQLGQSARTCEAKSEEAKQTSVYRLLLELEPLSFWSQTP